MGRSFAAGVVISLLVAAGGLTYAFGVPPFVKSVLAAETTTDQDRPTPRPPSTAPPSTSSPTPAVSPTPAAKPKPPALSRLEDRSDEVRELEARLVQLGLLSTRWLDGYFGTETRDGVV